jgi:putative two-component system response regulator
MGEPLESHSRPTVLVVDDDPANLQILNELLASQYEVRLANNGERGLQAAAQQPKPDAILLDVMMPGMDGYQMCALLKADEDTRDIPVLFLTSKAEMENAELAFELGGADYLTKPILPPVVRARVRTHVALHSSEMRARNRAASAPLRTPVVLVVDDTPANLQLLNDLLGEQYDLRIANSGERALNLALREPFPDLVLLDIMMPGMDGYEVCRRLKADRRTKDIPVIFLTAKAEIEDEQAGFDAGAVDYITKPISPPIVQARVRTHLALKAAADFLKDQNAYLEREVEKRTREVQVIQDVTIMAMASLAETRDNETGNHIRRTQHYVRALALALRTHPRFSAALDDTTIELLYKSAPLHDIGKVGIPDAILLKPGKLTPEEFEIMKTHTTLGRDAIVAAEGLIDAPSTFLRFAREIAHYHQEKWDGSGYPEGLAGESIPVSARLMALADVYDALISRRVYKPPFPREKAVAIIREGRDRHFDPDMVDAFLDIEQEFHAIAERYADSEEDVAVKARAKVSG